MDFFEALSQFIKLDSTQSAGVILLIAAALVWSNLRGSNKIILAITGTLGKQSEEHNVTQAEIKTSRAQEQRHHEEQTAILKQHMDAFTEVIQHLKGLTGEVSGMRSDNQQIIELKQQIAALQITTQEQARQLEAQAMEITTLRESNDALTANLARERQEKIKLEKELTQERERKQQEVDLLKAQFNKLQDEIFLEKQAKTKNVTKPKPDDKPSDTA